MSANICSANHINAILNFANRAQLAPRVKLSDGRLIDFSYVEDLDHCAELLSRQNWNSVNTRYEAEEPVVIVKFSMKCPPYTPAEIIKACDGYDYQACETADYEDTDAAKIVRVIRHTAINALPEYRSAKTWQIE